MPAYYSALGLLVPWQHPRAFGARVVSTWRSSDAGQEGERKEREENKEKPERRSSTCPSCQTLLITAELCPAGWLAAFRGFHLAEVTGDESSSSSHLKSVTIHPRSLGNFRTLLGCLGLWENVCLPLWQDERRRRYLIRDSQSHMSVPS